MRPDKWLQPIVPASGAPADQCRSDTIEEQQEYTNANISDRCQLCRKDDDW
jgi:hypothetical protein